MIARLSDWLRAISRGWIVLAALVVFLLFAGLALPYQNRRAEAVAKGAGSPDTSFYYTPADLYRMAETYGPLGRQAYVRARYTFDVAWPIVYVVFLATAISWVGGRALPAASRWQRANIVPLLGGLFDYLENVAASLVMLRYPSPTPVAAELAPIFTMVKWLLIAAAFAFLLVACGVAVIRHIRRPSCR